MSSPDSQPRIASASAPPSAGVAGAGTQAAPAPPREEGATLWPYAGLALAALVLAVLWKRGGGWYFLGRLRPGGARRQSRRGPQDRRA